MRATQDGSDAVHAVLTGRLRSVGGEDVVEKDGAELTPDDAPWEDVDAIYRNDNPTVASYCATRPVLYPVKK